MARNQSDLFYVGKCIWCHSAIWYDTWEGVYIFTTDDPDCECSHPDLKEEE